MMGGAAVEYRPHRRVRRARAWRGVSLIEGMTASVVLLIGLLGVFQGIIVASRQNSMANRATRAAGIASQVRVALDSMGRARLLGPMGNAGILIGGDCNPAGEVAELAGGLANVAPGNDDNWLVRCVFDFDAYERTAVGPNRMVPGYSETDAELFRRILVVIAANDRLTGVQTHQIAIVVSWSEMGQRRFVRQYVGFYDPGTAGNQSFVEI
jgi:hypothetical protein